MAKWLQNLLGMQPKKGASSARRTQVPVAQSDAPPPAPRVGRPLPDPVNLPNATVIYGIGAALLYVASLFLVLQGKWFSAIEVFVLGLGLTGFALHLLKHQD